MQQGLLFECSRVRRPKSRQRWFLAKMAGTFDWDTWIRLHGRLCYLNAQLSMCSYPVYDGWLMVSKVSSVNAWLLILEVFGV